MTCCSLHRPARFWLALAVSIAQLVPLCGGCNMFTGADDILLTDDGQASGGGQGAGVPTGAQAGGPALPVSPLCDEADCSPHGRCVVASMQPTCLCDPGYHAEGLGCVADPPPGPCDDVVCGAQAACVDGSCVCDDGYEGDPDAGCELIDEDEALARAELVQIASDELGYCEGSVERPYMTYQPGLWCYDFVAWVYGQSSYGLPSPIGLPRYDAEDLPSWWSPEPGDLIKFDIQHFGMVVDVSADGQVITTIEGNVNSCVMGRSVSLASIEYFGSLDVAF